MNAKTAPLATNSLSAELLSSIQASPGGLTLAELLAKRPAAVRRTVQRWLGQWVEQGAIVASGEGRARRYLGNLIASQPHLDDGQDSFPASIALSADSGDVLAYVDQPLTARKPVGYQADFLAAYQPNVTAYLSASLRRQLHKMGTTAQEQAPAGTHSRAILNRLLIDLSWASSQLEGNTYSRLDTRALIEHGQAAQGKAAIETQMILNHKTAIELLVDNVGTAPARGGDWQERVSPLVGAAPAG